ncbi:hypothetical protein [Actinocrispum sp. NPDC049592]|uniref:hypothetical protein n=1 Tax=Actinocrispum sp. NPDC049592 TaxID=3154835 RepID=UPI00342849A3
MVGVLLGSGATFLATSLVERSRWRRTQTSRWDDRRLTAYADYANSVKAAARMCQRIMVGKGILTGGQGIPLAEGLEALTEIGNERAVNWEPVLLLGEPETVRTAQGWAASVWELERLVHDTDIDQTGFITAYKESVRLRNLFYTCARRDLGVHLGELPQPEFPQFTRQQIAGQNNSVNGSSDK